MARDDTRARARLYALLCAGIALAVVVNLPLLELPDGAGQRVRHWAIFTGGLLVGAALARLRAAMR